MSDTAHEVRRRTPTRVRGLGDAVPVFRPFRDDSNDIKIVPKSSDELRAESEARRDAQPMTTRCAVDDCDWTHTGTAGDCRIEAATHRASRHPQLSGASTRKRGVHFKRRGEQVDPATVAESRRLRQEKDDATRLETINRGRKARGELLEETASTGDVGAASSSGTLDSLAAGESAGPSGHARVQPGHGPVATEEVHIPRASQPAASTTTTRRAPMRRWTRESLIAELQQVSADLGHTPTSPELTDRKLGSMLTKKFLAHHGFTSYKDLCVSAGLTPNTTGRNGGKPGRTIPAATTKKTSPVPATPAAPQAPPVRQLLTEPVVADQSVAVLAAEHEQAGVDLAAARERYTAARAALASHPTIAQLQEEAAA